MVSTFGKFADSGEYVFFAADSHHPNYELIGNVVNSQIYVSTYALHDYPVNEANILHRGEDAWNAALNTVNVGKYNLGSAGRRHRHPRVLRGDQPRREQGALRQNGHRLPARPQAVHRRLRAAGGDETGHRPGR